MADPAPPEAPSAAAAPVAAAVADPAADPAANSGAPPVAAPPEDAQPAEDAQLAAPPGPFSWLDPHPIFVIILVGPEEHPYGMQMDYLCARSKYYREYFRVHSSSDSIEYVVKLPDTPAEIFAYAQNYLYTGKVFPTLETLPPYEVLIQLWKLGHQLGIDGLCDATLEAMTECRRVTETIPSTPLLVQVWHDTPEDSSIRKLLLSWAAEYMRSSISRKEFAKSLPQEVLSELVVTMSSLDGSPFPQGGKPLPEANPQGHHKNVHRIDLEEGETPAPTGTKKKARHSDVLPNGSASTQPKPAATGKKPRTSLPAHKPPKKRSTVSFVSDQPFSTDQKMNFCADLLTRMLSGPGFWTRLVGPFKEPVDPHMDGVPDYLQKITRPMDLGTMKAKMDRHEYRDEQEFVGDMRQIFSNCYTYWTKKDPMWTACEKLEKTFEEKYSQMNKWISKMEGEEMA